MNVHRPRLMPWLAVAGLCTSVPVLAQNAEQVRLSSLLTSVSEKDYLSGLSWHVRSEIPHQQARRQHLLDKLSGHPKLTQSLARLPVTGRVPVAMADGRWLEVHPDRDPVLRAGMTVFLPQRPQSVSVLTEDGRRCVVPHTPGALLLEVLKSCSGVEVGDIDWAWVIQPDGRVERYGIAQWNQQQAAEAAPGAWLWAPSRSAAIPDNLSDELAAFLASQGPALDTHTPGRWLFPKPSSGATPMGSQATLPASQIVLAPQMSQRGWNSPQDLQMAPSDWGSMGLLQTPTARMAPVGEGRVHISRVQPYTRMNVFLQPFEWLEAGFRYTDVSNRLYGPADLSGQQSYKDKGMDAKFRLLSETRYLPELAVGFRDMAGTGMFSGEYVVASKRSGPVDLSLGMAWGYGSGLSTLRNPFSALSKRFDTRSATGGGAQGGQFAISNYFSGLPALFGGVQLQLPGQPWLLKLEYDGNDYRNEPMNNQQIQKSHWNLGLVYRWSPRVDLSVGVERGNTVMVALNLHTELNRMSTRKLSDAPLPPVSAPRPSGPINWSAVREDLEKRNDWQIRKIEQDARTVRVTVDEARGPYWHDRANTTAAVLNHHSPKDIDTFTVSYAPNGVPTTDHVIDRDAWVKSRQQPLPPSEDKEAVKAQAPEPKTGTVPLDASPKKLFESGFGLGFRHSLGGPDGFILYQVLAVHRARLNLAPSTWLQSTVELGLIDNYNKYRYTAPSNLPRVRTYMREYTTESKVHLANLQATHVGRLTKDQTISLYAGYLEAMYAGVGAEWLYRPWGSRLALGIDANAVQARDFSQGFSLRDYRVKTGHATLYWDTGWNDIQANVSVGQYLAGDRGATVELSRSFRNGVRMGAYFTKTNVSAQQFGEGSFDKGVFVSIPFDAFLTRSSKNTASFIWQPLIRDGGAKLSRSVNLYELTQGADPRALEVRPARPAPDEVSPAEHEPRRSPP